MCGRLLCPSGLRSSALESLSFLRETKSTSNGTSDETPKSTYVEGYSCTRKWWSQVERLLATRKGTVVRKGEQPASTEVANSTSTNYTATGQKGIQNTSNNTHSWRTPQATWQVKHSVCADTPWILDSSGSTEIACCAQLLRSESGADDLARSRRGRSDHHRCCRRGEGHLERQQAHQARHVGDL